MHVISLKYLFLHYVYKGFACFSVSATYACLVTVRPDEGIRSPRTRVRDSFELPCECWELNLVPLQEKIKCSLPSLQLLIDIIPKGNIVHKLGTN